MVPFIEFIPSLNMPKDQLKEERPSCGSQLVETLQNRDSLIFGSTSTKISFPLNY
jgi:hypothetical protein